MIERQNKYLATEGIYDYTHYIEVVESSLEFRDSSNGVPRVRQRKVSIRQGSVD